MKKNSKKSVCDRMIGKEAKSDKGPMPVKKAGKVAIILAEPLMGGAKQKKTKAR